ncbi:hypothetical protein [Anaerotruncus colihominis]
MPTLGVKFFAGRQTPAKICLDRAQNSSPVRHPPAVHTGSNFKNPDGWSAEEAVKIRKHHFLYLLNFQAIRKNKKASAITHNKQAQGKSCVTHWDSDTFRTADTTAYEENHPF